MIMRLARRHVAITTIMLTTICSSAYADGVTRNPPQRIPGGTVQSAVVHKGGDNIVVQGLLVGAAWLTIASHDPEHATLKLSGKTLDEVEGGMGFNSVTQADGHTYVVISDMLGGAATPSNIKVLDVSPSGAVLSPDLGQSGDDQPKVTLIDGGIKLSMSYTPDQPNRTITFVNDRVESVHKASLADARFGVGDCVVPSHGWRVYSRPAAAGPVTKSMPHEGMFVTGQTPKWTGLSDVSGTAATLGWMRTAELEDVAYRNCNLDR